jgi:hypothetical protein
MEINYRFKMHPILTFVFLSFFSIIMIKHGNIQESNIFMIKKFCLVLNTDPNLTPSEFESKI